LKVAAGVVTVLERDAPDERADLIGPARAPSSAAWACAREIRELLAEAHRIARTPKIDSHLAKYLLFTTANIVSKGIFQTSRKPI
jgi:hypothetical protein